MVEEPISPISDKTPEHLWTRQRIFRRVFNAVVFLVLTVNLGASFWTEWRESSANPVFDPVPRAYYPSVIYDPGAFSGHGPGAYYKMWFARGDGIAFAYSDDGLNWNQYNASAVLPGLASGASHPVVLYDASGFGMQGNSFYRIWYWDSNASLGSINAIRTAASADGVTWQNDQPIQQHASDPSLQLVAGYGIYGNYFYHCYGPGCLLHNPDAANIGATTPLDRSDDQPMTWSYVMYYDSSSEGFSPNGSVEQTSLAYSTDGFYWIRHGDQPVLLPSGSPSDWDGLYSYRPAVLQIDGTWHMWYSGANGNSGIGTPYAHGIGHASSADGIHWARDPDNPAMHVADGLPWRSVRTYTPSVVCDRSRFTGHGEPCLLKMLFSGYDNSNYAIGYAAICPADQPPLAIVADPLPPTRVGDLIILDGNESYDPDGDPIVSYGWEIRSRPSGSSFPPPAGDGPAFVFTADVEGDYIVCLTVSSQSPSGEILWSDPVCTTVSIRGYNYCDCPVAILDITMLEDRMWLGVYRIARLTWSVTAPIPACSLSGFRLFRLENGSWRTLAELDTATRSYEDGGVWADPQYRVVPLRGSGQECQGRIHGLPVVRPERKRIVPPFKGRS